MLVTPDGITQYAHEHIPITKYMGITVLTVDDEQIALLAPYAPNVNHRETIFGGSLSSLGILAGWALLWAKLQAESIPNRLVIQSSSTTFLKPATEAIVAHCQCDRDRWLTFYTTLQRHGKARITLSVRKSLWGYHRCHSHRAIRRAQNLNRSADRSAKPALLTSVYALLIP